MAAPHSHLINVYYEDTDFSGVVYHSNYLKYFERAREHFLGREELVRLWREEGIGFVVYKAELTYREGARFGDVLDIRTRVELNSAYRAIFHQDVYRVGGTTPMVQGIVHLVCVDSNQKLIRLPTGVVEVAKS